MSKSSEILGYIQRKGLAITGSILAGGLVSACQPADLGRMYINYNTRLKPSVDCNPKGEPTLSVKLETNKSIAEKVVIKATSEQTGKTAEQELEVKGSDGQNLAGTVNFKEFEHDSSGKRIREKIQPGEVINVVALRIEIIHGNQDSNKIISAQDLKKPMRLVISCPQSDRLSAVVTRPNMH